MQTNTIAKKLRGRGSETLKRVGNSCSAFFVSRSSANAFHPEVAPVTVIRDITKFGEEGLTDQDLVREEGSDKRVIGKGLDMAVSQNDNGGRRLGLERREFSYDIHLPERRSNAIRRSNVDRRNGIFSRMNSRKWRDAERRAAFL
jgi:hypothetical protein